MCNASCEERDYIFGFGWPDTEDIEGGYRYWYPALYQTRDRILPYREEGIFGSGITFTVLGDHTMYEGTPDGVPQEAETLWAVAVWKRSDAPYAYEVVSWLTC